MEPFVLRPSIVPALPSSGSSNFQPPSSGQLLGQWFIVHTSLPFWRDKRNITVAYSMPPSPTRSTNLVHDLVTYKPLNSGKLKTMQGINTPTHSDQEGAWDWRGSGWVRVVSNHWEILGHGSHESGDEGQWIVIHTQKSLFTPAAIHVYSRNKVALAEETRESLVAALAKCQNFKDLVENMFQIQQD